MKSWIVPSQSDPKRNYVVILNDDGSWSCECPDHKYRGRECKHIYAVKLMLEMVRAEGSESACREDLKPRELASSIEAMGQAPRALEVEEGGPKCVDHPMLKPEAVERKKPSMSPEELKGMVAKTVEERGSTNLFEYCKRYGVSRKDARKVAEELANEKGWKIEEAKGKLYLRKPEQVAA